MVSLDFNSIKW